ncbi:hypothetical protein [Levilactobacillus brevis]|uniref:hypothetical protein n=1 Tax=Levilactobacillus brevis TaxID=1580 RepID=UPI003EBD5FF8
MKMKLAIADGSIIKPTADDAKFTGVVGDDGKYSAKVGGLTNGQVVATGDYQAFFFDPDTKKVLGDYFKVPAFTFEGGVTPTNVTTESEADGEKITADAPTGTGK